MGQGTDIRCVGAILHYLPVETRMPLKFGIETLCAPVFAAVDAAPRACLQRSLRAGAGFTASGAADSRGCAHIGAGQLGDDLFNRPARSKLYDGEIDHHYPQ